MTGRSATRISTAAELSQQLDLQWHLGQVIRRRREALGLSQEQLAQALGSHRPLISRAEKGRHALSLDTLFRYARALQCSVSELLHEAETVPNARASLATASTP